MHRATWNTLCCSTLLALALALPAPAAAAAKAATGNVKRGEYLVTIGSCNDCHTPTKMGPQGPEPDMSRMLAGHPAEAQVPPGPAMTGPWIAAVTATMTAWYGPWGTSFTANLTPDPETGLGKWTEANFIEAMRTGRHMGRGRPILPPMPVMWIGKMTDSDLKAVFAYLRTVKPINNRVPDPLPPPAGAQAAGGGAPPSGNAPPSGQPAPGGK